MLQKNEEKNNSIIKLENSISNILVVNKLKSKPFIEAFEYQAENISLQSLGTLLGFFKIKDSSEDSAYIVNFLTSVLKKEYYSNSKRGVNNSFDAALHKVNLALAELAKHGNIKWLGNLDAAICVLEKTNLHFSVSGKSKILLLRNKNLLDISEGFEISGEPNPLKTFVDVSSGHLENLDKLLITSDDIFQVFSLNELKKASSRFTKDNFVQFIQTALVNEKELAVTFVVDMFKAEEAAIKKPKEKKNKYYQNAFSEKTFQEQRSDTAKIFPPEIKLNEEKEEYTDEKTGHIYVQDQTSAENNQKSSNQHWFFIKEKLSDVPYFFKKTSKKIISTSKKSFYTLKDYSSKIKFDWPKRKPPVQKSEKNASEAIFSDPQKIVPNVFFHKFNSLEFYFKKNLSKISQRSKWAIPYLRKFFLAIIPSFSKIKNYFRLLDRLQKLSSLAIVLLIIILPMLFLRFKNQEKIAQENKSIADMNIIQEPALQEKNITSLSAEKDLSPSLNSLKIIRTADSVIIVSGEKIIVWQEGGGKEFPIPQNFGVPVAAGWMNDLKLAFILTDQNKIVSFSPVSSKFQENKIDIPAESKISFIGTYLTYLYLADTKNSQIYRYPRAEGGFGNKVNWLKDQTDLSNVTNMAVDENIYLANNNQLSQFFKGKRQDFNLEKTLSPLNIDSIYLDIETGNIYVLDKKNKRIAKFDKSGALLKNYTADFLKEARNFSIDENNKKLYVAGSNKLVSFDLE
jgi:hypothetical protein